MAQNCFMEADTEEELAEESEVWATPRASWHTTCDGYIQLGQLSDVYSKITRNKNSGKMLTSHCQDTARDNGITYSSHVTLSYTASKVRRRQTKSLLSADNTIQAH